MKERINLGIKYRADIEAGKYRVETRRGFPARIICWDLHDKYPIVAAVDYYRYEVLHSFSADGRECREDDEHDLFLVPVEQDTCTITGWVARDEDGDAELYVTKPCRSKVGPYWTGDDIFELLRDEFPSLTWEDEPIEVTLTIKREEESK